MKSNKPSAKISVAKKPSDRGDKHIAWMAAYFVAGEGVDFRPMAISEMIDGTRAKRVATITNAAILRAMRAYP